MTDTPPVLLVDSDGPVRIVTMNRPDSLNAFTDDLHHAVASVWGELGRDPEVRAVVLTGAGRAFSAGGDVPGFKDQVANEVRRRANIREAGRLLDEMLRFHLPVVAAVNGPAVGLGSSLAVLSDVVFMSEDTFFADPHVTVGLVAADGGAVTWPSVMSILQAKEYLFTGDRIPASEAYRLGLANHVVPRDQVVPQAVAFAHRLAAQPPQALQDTKRALNLHMRAAALRVAPFALASEELSFTTDDVARISENFGK